MKPSFDIRATTAVAVMLATTLVPLLADPTAAPAVTAPPTAAKAFTSDSPPPTAPIDLGAPKLGAIPAHKILRVAVYQGPGSGAGAPHDMAVAAFAQDPNLIVTVVTPADIQAGKLSGYDVLVQPGGSGGGQGRALGEAGRDNIRAFVKGGGGYIGVCGGSYLATVDYPWSLGILNAHVQDKAHWARGHGPVVIAPTAAGKTHLNADVSSLPIVYWQGPLLAPADDTALPAYENWATFQTEIAKHGAPVGVMTGTTAVAAASYGRGRVVCFSPHPEKVIGEAALLQRALLWAAADRLSASHSVSGL